MWSSIFLSFNIIFKDMENLIIIEISMSYFFQFAIIKNEVIILEITNKTYKVADYIKIPLKVDPITVVIILAIKVFEAFIPCFQVLATSNFVDTAIDIFKNGEKARIYMSLFFIIVLIGLSWISSMILSFVKSHLSLRMNENIRIAVIKKRSVIAYEYIENNDTWDLISRVGENPSEQMLNGFNNLLNILEYLIKIMSLVFIITTQVWWIAIAIVLISIPLFSLSFKCGKIDYEAFSDSQKYLRKANYLKTILSSRECIEERTLFGYTNSIDKMWFDKYEMARKIEYNAEKRNFIRTKTASTITAFLSMTIALVLLVPIKSGKITVGMYMGLVGATFNLVKKMSWELSNVMQQYAKNKVYLKDLTEFSFLKEVKGSDGLPDVSIQKLPFESIEFKNVHFGYPGTERKILNGLSMRLEKNKQYAFVGKNGAGKTTITKLLTGLYDNYEGVILINGKNIKNFSQEQLKAYFSIVYQDFAKYQITIKDNVLLGNCGQSSWKDKQELLVKNALKSIEIGDYIDNLPNGINTSLGKLLEDGIDLSVGQWQRIAIARTLISNAPINILDEPTAALDPINESKVYSLFKKISKGKSTILITHRLGAARIADEILVIDKGVIAERGSHKELLNKKGIYAEMFEAQRSWYNE